MLYKQRLFIITFLLYQSCVYAAASQSPSWADVVRGAPKQTAQACVTHESNPSVKYSSKPTPSGPSYILPRQADRLFCQAMQISSEQTKEKTIEDLETFLDKYARDPRHMYARVHLADLYLGSKHVDKQKRASKIHELLMPVLKAKNNPHHPYLPAWQIHASEIMASSYLAAKDKKAASVSLMNALGFAFNNELWMPSENGLPPFAWHNPQTMLLLASLVQDKSLMEDFENWVASCTPTLTEDEQNSFIETFLHYAHLNGSEPATLLLANFLFLHKQFDEACAYYDKLSEDFDARTCVSRAVCNWLSDKKNEDQKKRLAHTCMHNEHENVLTLLEVVAPEAINDLWYLLFQYQSGAIKAKAAYHLSACEENAQRAEIYRNIAAAHSDLFTSEQLFQLAMKSKRKDVSEKCLIKAAKQGYEPACKKALAAFYILEKKEDQDEKNDAFKFLDAAAQGGYVEAQLSCGVYWKKHCAFVNASGKKEAAREAIERAEHWLSLAAKNSDTARLEHASLGNNYIKIIERVKLLAQDDSFSRQTDAQYVLGHIYREYMQHLHAQKKPYKLIARKKECMFYWFQKAADSGNTDAQHSLVTALLMESEKNKRKHKEYESKALDLAKKVLQQYPKHVDMHNTMATYWCKKNCYDKAADHFIQALKAEPKNVQTTDFIDEMIKEVITKKGLEKASPLLKKIINENPHNSKYKIALARCYLKKDEAEKAIKMYKDTAQTGCADAYFDLAKAYYSADHLPKDYHKAAYWGHKALEQQPNHMQTLDMLGFIHRAWGHDDKAQAFWKKSADAGSAHGAYKCAQCFHYGTGGTYDVAQASDYYLKAARRFFKPEDTPKGLECAGLARALNFQQKKLLRSQPGKTLVERYQALRKKILDVLKYNTGYLSPDIPQNELDRIHEHITAGCHQAFAIHALEMSELVPEKANHYMDQASTHLSKSTYTENIPAYTMSALSLINSTPLVPLEMLRVIDQKSITSAQRVFEHLIVHLEAEQPHNYFLPHSYHALGLIMRSVHKKPEEAKVYFKAGIKHNSISCCINLSRLFLENEKNFDKANKYLKKAEDLARELSESSLDENIKILKLEIEKAQRTS